MMTAYISAEQAATALGVTPEAVTKACREGRLQADRIGRAWLIPADAVKNVTLGRQIGQRAYRRNSIETVLERLVRDEETGCWNWTGYTNHSGYGAVSLGRGRLIRVHRLVYEHFVGPIPDGYHCDHQCGNRLCAEPSHIALLCPSDHSKRHHPRTKATRSPQPMGRPSLLCDIARVNIYHTAGHGLMAVRELAALYGVFPGSIRNALK